MVSPQEWLDENYPKEGRRNIRELNIYKNLEGHLDLSDFVNLEEFNCRYSQISLLNLSNLVYLRRIDCRANKLTKLKVNRLSNLEYFDCSYNQLTKLTLNPTKLRELNCSGNQLTALDLSKFSQLEEINCYSNQLTSLTLPQDGKVKKLYCYDDYLTHLDWTALNPELLTHLSLGDNNFPEQDLSVFGKLVNLKTLWLRNDNREKFNLTIYNRWIGSLKSLHNLTKLTLLDFSNTDIDSGLEYLPKSLWQMYCNSDLGGKNWGVKKIKVQLKDHWSSDSELYDFRSWRIDNKVIISQILTNESSLNIIVIINQSMVREQDDNIISINEKVFLVLSFYLEEELLVLRSELYGTEQQVQIQTPPNNTTTNLETGIELNTVNVVTITAIVIETSPSFHTVETIIEGEQQAQIIQLPPRND